MDSERQSLPVWDQQDALARIKNRADRLCRLIDIFLDSVPARVEELCECIAQSQPEAAARIAHEIKGVAGNLGATELYHIMLDTEAATRQQDSEQLTELATIVPERFQALVSELKSFKAEHS